MKYEQLFICQLYLDQASFFFFKENGLWQTLYYVQIQASGNSGWKYITMALRGFSDSSVVKNLPADAEDMGSISDPSR